MNWLKKVFNWLNGVRVRPGMQEFLGRWQEQALDLVIGLSQTKNNQDFHSWRSEAHQKAKEFTGEIKDNWIAIMISLAFEEAKSRKLIK